MIPKINHIRYSTLANLLEGTPLLTRDSRVNFFINLEPIFRKMLSRNYNKYLQTMPDNRVFELVSDIVNIAAHYRSYFTNKGVYSSIYLYFGSLDSTKYLNTDFNSTYRAYFHERFRRNESIPFMRTLDQAIPIVKSILSYVEDVHLIQTTNIEPSLLPLCIKQEFSQGNENNVILTNDPYEYQYTNYGFYILKPNMENSQLLSSENVMERIKFESKITSDVTLHPNYIPFILSFMTDPFRSIEGVYGMGVGKIIKMIKKAIDGKLLAEEGTTITIISNILDSKWADRIAENHATIDLSKQIVRFDISNRVDIEKQLINRFDNISLKKLNEEIFTNHPLMLMELQTKNTGGTKKKHVFDI